MIQLYLLEHKYLLNHHIEKKSIGIFSNAEKARAAIESLILMPGFCDHPEGFIVRKTYRFKTQKLLDQIFWEEGFDTVVY